MQFWYWEVFLNLEKASFQNVHSLLFYNICLSMYCNIKIFVCVHKAKNTNFCQYSQEGTLCILIGLINSKRKKYMLVLFITFVKVLKTSWTRNKKQQISGLFRPNALFLMVENASSQSVSWNVSHRFRVIFK